MTKLKMTMVGTLASFLLLTGCADKAPTVEEASALSGECIVENTEAPQWVCGQVTASENEYVDIGIAPISKIGIGFARREALANARSNLAQQVQTEVKDKVETFMRSTGIGSSEVGDKVSTQVSKQVAKVTMTNSRQRAFWQTKSNIYLLVSMTKGDVVGNTKSALKTSFKKDEALWQQFQAKQSLEGLEKEFED